MPRISLIVPAFNEEKYLPALLDSVDAARTRYSRGAREVEVIVADNASTDGTADVALSRGCILAHVNKPVIAASRNGGAAVASGEIVAFIDADCTIHPETFNVIDETMSSPKTIAGATGARFDRRSLGIAATTLLGEILFFFANLDIGVVFCRREDWAAVGGYNEELKVAEDVEFLVALKKRGKARRQKFVRAKGARAVTSARKFDARGDWHYFFMGPPTALFYMIFNRAALQRQIGDSLISEYWYDVRKNLPSPRGSE
jgi:glycosyltransferase involved in cell wall biosynthesis